MSSGTAAAKQTLDSDKESWNKINKDNPPSYQSNQDPENNEKLLIKLHQAQTEKPEYFSQMDFPLRVQKMSTMAVQLH